MHDTTSLGCDNLLFRKIQITGAAADATIKPVIAQNHGSVQMGGGFHRLVSRIFIVVVILLSLFGFELFRRFFRVEKRD